MSALVREESLAQQGYRAIRRAIRDGRIPRGQFFSEPSLAESLGVSRTPVREALLNLFRDGVVEIVPKRGYRLVELDDAAIVEIRLLRAALEQIVVERLCTTVTPEQIRELRALLGRVHAAGGKREDMYAVDEAFHIRMAEMAELWQIRRELLSVRGKMYLIASGTQVAATRDASAVDEHARVVDALERRDCDAARRAVTEHVERSVDAFVTAREALAPSRRMEPLA
jgi:DNA-binding GntR family transcriptional regulator